MIDIETDVFDKVARAVLAEFPGAYVTSTYQAQVAAFPAVWLRQAYTSERLDTVSSSGREEYDSLTYEAQVFAATADGGRAQAKAVLDVADGKMRQLGFVRSYCQEMDNAADTSVSRYVARWTGTVEHTGDIYGR